MSGILQFFLNAFKAIIFGPFYVLYFCLHLIVAIINHILGEFKVLFTGFKYANKDSNKYSKKVNYLMRKSGDK